MPRTPSCDQDNGGVITDDQSIIASVAQGEQLHLHFTLHWLTDMTGFSIVAKVTEGANAPGDGYVPPTEEDATLTVTELPIIDDVENDNMFKVVFPENLIDLWDVKPTPDDPVYGFFALSVGDTGIGENQQIFVPVRGLVEVKYNAAESS